MGIGEPQARKKGFYGRRKTPEFDFISTAVFFTILSAIMRILTNLSLIQSEHRQNLTMPTLITHSEVNSEGSQDAMASSKEGNFGP